MKACFGLLLRQLTQGRILCALVLTVAGFSGSANADYRDHPLAIAFINKMIIEHGFEKDYLLSLMAHAEKKDSILEKISRPAERRLEWKQYSKIFLKSVRVAQGVEFWQQHKETLLRAEREYGVPPEIILGILGVETRYGRIMGNDRVLDALTTIGFDYPKRGKFFRGELEAFMLMVREQSFDPLALKGSYAGAMGYGQFISSSYRAYAVDFDGDNVADILTNPVDAIGSIANYFAKHGWQAGQPVTMPLRESKSADQSLKNDNLKPKHTVASLKKAGYSASQPLSGKLPANVVSLNGDNGEELWLGLKNFYVITRYNHSRLYAMAVYQLSQMIAEEIK